ncbi:TPA: DUF551 domain-containing protein [Enterobacter hormaechei]
MSTLTKEWLHQTIADLEEERDATPGAVNEDAAKALAAMKLALASLEAEAVAEVCEGFTLRYIGHGPAPKSGVHIGDRLYTAPPASVSVPDEMDGHGGVCCEVSYADGWNACRAAMLQGADGNSPVIPDGWVACSERMPEAGDDMIVFTDDIVMSGVSYSKKKGFYLQALEYDDDEPVDNVTHWMPLPAAPQQEVKP